MKTRRRSSILRGILPIVAASVVLAGATAMAQQQRQAEAERLETRQETTRTVRYYEETIRIVGRGVTGDVPRPPANELAPEYTERERLWYDLSQKPGL